MAVFSIILLSALVQLAAAGVALRINRITTRPLAWVLMSTALVLMAARRVYLLLEFRTGGPASLLLSESLGLVISILLLGGMLLVQRIFQDQAEQAASLVEARRHAREDADKLTAVMAAVPVPMWIAEDDRCRVIRGNPAGAALLRMPHQANHSASADTGRLPDHFRLVQGGRVLAPEDMPMQRAVLRGEKVQGEPLDLVFQEAEVRHLMAYATPLTSADGRIQGAVCCSVDLTEVRLAEEALAKAHKMESLGLLAGGLAHDFNNIFQAMMTHLEMARAALPGEARVLTHLDRLQVSLERASKLSRDILHCSGGDLRRPESLDLSSVVADTLARLDLGVVQDLAVPLPRIMMDPVLVGRVVEGLVTNALEASSARSAIRVRTFMRQVGPAEQGSGYWPEPMAGGLYAVIEISDQGHGISQDMLPRVFDPFFSTRGMGRGLGLAAALGIVRGHRGGIQVESLAGVGSVFRVHLSCPETLDLPPAPPEERPHLRHVVLLADDEGELRAVMGELLQDWFGLDVVPAADGQEALDLFTQRPEAFDLVILDATMPRMGGVEAFQAMRRIRPGLPGVLCSGYALPASREQAVAQGFADFLKKPFASAELKAALDQALGSRVG